MAATKILLSRRSSLLTSLPAVLKTRIACYLDCKDAVRLSLTCKTLASDICISALNNPQPYELLFSQIWLGETMTGDVPCRGELIPIFSSRHSHSIRITCRWKDQGWGERKGRLYIVSSYKRALTLQENIEEEEEDLAFEKAVLGEDLFHGGRVVCESPLVGHDFSTLELSFSPKVDEVYYTWYQCGGGGGHLLMVENLVMHTLVFDDQERSMQQTYSKLCQLGLLDLGGNYSSYNGEEEDDLVDENLFGEHNEDLAFSTKLLMACVEFLLLQEDNDPDIPAPRCGVTSFLDLNDTGAVDRQSLLTMRLICHFFLQYVDHKTPAYVHKPEISDEPLEVPKRADEVELPPFTLIPYISWEGDAGSGDIPAKSTRIPTVHGFTKSIRLTCQWKDAGIENPRGQLFIVAHNTNKEKRATTPDQDPLPFFNGGRVVCESPIVSHVMAPLELSFCPSEDEIYYVYQKSGGVDGSLLHVEDLAVHLTVADDSHGNLQMTYKDLQKCGALNRRDEDRAFYFRLLLTVAVQLHQHVVVKKQGGDHRPHPLAVFLEAHGFQIQESALRSLWEILQCMVNLNDQRKPFKVVSSSNDTTLLYRTHAAM